MLSFIKSGFNGAYYTVRQPTHPIGTVSLDDSAPSAQFEALHDCYMSLEDVQQLFAFMQSLQNGELL